LGDEQSNEKLDKNYNMRFAGSANDAGSGAAFAINTRRRLREVAGK
jgi:hypothetical protein